MAHKDPARKQEYNRQYYAANGERVREQSRKYYAANAEQKREYARKYRREHPDAGRETIRERHRRWEQKNPERVREKARQQWQKRKASGYRDRRLLDRDRVVTVHWRSQDGHCYLCGEPLLLEEAVLEHDHRCCPKGAWCSHCIRGAAHVACNSIIGHAVDDPDLLEEIARNLRVKLAEMDDRLAAKPQQLTLDDADEAASA